MKSQWLMCLLLSQWPVAQVALADGGAIRLSERVGDYQVTAFTSPTPPRVGPVDVSVFLQRAATGQPIVDAKVTAILSPKAQPDWKLPLPATLGAGTNKMYYSLEVDWPAAGAWTVTLEITGPGERVETSFDMEVAEAPPEWRELAWWIALPIVPILLFCLHQTLTRRRGDGGSD